MMKYAGTMGLRAVATPPVATTRATKMKNSKLTTSRTGSTAIGTPERQSHTATNSRLPKKPTTAVR